MQIDWGLWALLLCISAPVLIIFGLYLRPNRSDEKNQQGGMRFLGTQMDLAILIFGICILLALLAWIREAFFG